MAYRVEFTPSAARTWRKLAAALRGRISPKVDGLAAHPRPHGAEKLSGSENRYRIRVGDYRVVYEIDDASCR